MKGFILESEEATLTLAEKLGRVLTSGDCLVLTGELGAGKTTFTKGLAKGLDIEQMVKSPTYTIVREYHKGRLPLFHLDVYRLENGGSDLGLEEYFEAEGVTVVEWGQLIADELPASYVELSLTYQEATEQRYVTVHAVGPTGDVLRQRLLQAIDHKK